jgi:hypothetical protein
LPVVKPVAAPDLLDDSRYVQHHIRICGDGPDESTVEVRYRPAQQIVKLGIDAAQQGTGGHRQCLQYAQRTAVVAKALPNLLQQCQPGIRFRALVAGGPCILAKGKRPEVKGDQYGIRSGSVNGRVRVDRLLHGLIETGGYQFKHDSATQGGNSEHRQKQVESPVAYYTEFEVLEPAFKQLPEFSGLLDKPVQSISLIDTQVGICERENVGDDILAACQSLAAIIEVRRCLNKPGKRFHLGLRRGESVGFLAYDLHQVCDAGDMLHFFEVKPEAEIHLYSEKKPHLRQAVPLFYLILSRRQGDCLVRFREGVFQNRDEASQYFGLFHGYWLGFQG